MSVTEFVSGALFAVGLFSSGVYSADVIKGQFSFTSNVMLTTMLGASAASAIVMDIVDRFGYMKRTASPPSRLGFFQFDGNLLGGLLIGVGMASTGACPGTSFVQAGTGSLNGLLVIFGGLLGAFTFVKLQDSLTRARAQSEGPAAATPQQSPRFEEASKSTSDIATALGVSPLLLLLVWVPMCLAAMRIAFAQDQSHAHAPSPGLIPPSYGGLLIGFAQLVTVLLTGHAIGASGGYEDVARWLESQFSSAPATNGSKRHLLTPSVMFSAGIFSSGALLSHIFNAGGPSTLQGLASLDVTHAAQAMAGGWAMVLGARIARGCTSGHGISGLSKFSLPSLVTTASMFGAGILTATVLQH